MKDFFVLYNPLSGNGKGEKTFSELKEKISGIAGSADVTKIPDLEAFLAEKSEYSVLIIGGDGTLNRFVNSVKDVEALGEIYFYPSGTGNDFLRDLGETNVTVPIEISKYLVNLPVCEIDGKEYRFINGIGFGIDGYCCEVGDEIRRKNPDTDINYAGIAIKGLLFHYKPTVTKVTVDGKEYEFKKVWIAPTMNGRFYGGGMMPTPNQKRISDDKKVSLCLLHTFGKIRTLAIFPSIFKGEHVKHTKAASVFEGKEITVEFDSPRSLQIDGETMLGIKKYKVSAAAKEDLVFTASKEEKANL